MSDEVASGLKRAIRVLECLGNESAGRPDGVGVVEIGRLLGVEKSQVSRTLKALAEAGLVERDTESRGYRLGWRLFALAASSADPRLLAIAPGVLRQLVSVFGESAHVSTLQGAEVLTVLSESPPHSLKASSWIGRTAPLHSTSSGRALLFDHTEDEIRTLLDGVDFVPSAANTPRDVDDLIARLGAARRRGFAVCDEEFEPGLIAVAAPIRGFRGAIVAALNISAPKFRFDRIDAAGQHLVAAARHLSLRDGAGSTAGAPPTGATTNRPTQEPSR